MKKIISLILIVTILLSLVVLFEENQVEAAQIAGLTNGKQYYLRNVGSGKYLNVHLGIDANGTNVYQWTKDSSTEQKFTLVYKELNDTYKFKTMCSSNGRVLDITRSGGPVVSGANVKIWTDTDPTSQDFKIIHVGGGKYKIVPLANTSVALTTKGDENGSSAGTNSTSSGNVFVETYKSDSNPDQKYQHWNFEEVITISALGITSGEIYYIRNKRSGKYLDVCGNQTEDHTQVQQYSVGEGLSQQWKVTYAGNGYYRIQTMLDSSKYLDGTSNPVNNTKVQIYRDDGSYEQYWKIIPNNDESENYPTSYRIVCKKNEFSMCLAVNGATNNNNERVIAYEYGYAENDNWYFERKPIIGYTYQNTSYGVGCNMYGHSINSFVYYINNINGELSNIATRSFLYSNTSSYSNDLKNKQITGGTSYNNIDNVNMAIFTGHGYKKGRYYDGCGTPAYNSLHFGTTNSSSSHASNSGMISSANFTTYDNRYFGYGTNTKWLVTYSCNFLNTCDPEVYKMLNNGGRLILGYSTRVYIVPNEGTDFANRIKNGEKLQTAFFESAKKWQDNKIWQTSDAAGNRTVACLFYKDTNKGEDTRTDTFYKQKILPDRSYIALYTLGVNSYYNYMDE